MTQSSRIVSMAASTLLALLVAVPCSQASPWFLQDKPSESKDEKKEGEQEGEEEEEEEETPDRWLAVTGGDIYTVTDGVLRGGTLLAKNGKIYAIGHDLVIPDEADRVDATGLRVYPGLIAVNSRGLLGSEPPEHSTDVFALNLVLGLSTGITTAVTGNTAAKLTYGTLEDMVVRRNLFTRVNLRSSDNWRQFESELEKIRAHQRAKRAYALAKERGEEEGEEPKPQGLNSGYVQMVEGDAIGRFNFSDSRSLLRLARLAREYGFRGVVFGASEGWVVADELGRSGLGVVLNPRTTRNVNRTVNRPNGSRIENAAMLHERGVPVSVVPSSAGISLNGLVGRDLFTLPVEAAYAVRGGLDRQSALESITIEAARILGIHENVGSLEVGKDCDVILTDGDVLHYRTLVQYAFVNGRLAYDKENESLLSHIRPLEEGGRFTVAEILEELEAVHPTEDETSEVEETPPVEGEETEGGEGTEEEGGEGGEEEGGGGIGGPRR